MLIIRDKVEWCLGSSAIGVIGNCATFDFSLLGFSLIVQLVRGCPLALNFIFFLRDWLLWWYKVG